MQPKNEERRENVITKYEASYEKYEELRDAKGVRDADVAKETGIYQSTFTDWKDKKKNSSPKLDKLIRIAQYFDVPVDVFIEARQV